MYNGNLDKSGVLLRYIIDLQFYFIQFSFFLLHHILYFLFISLSLLIYFSFNSCFSFFCMSVDVTDNAAFVVHAQLGPEEAGSLTYYVPVIVMDAEEDGE